MALPEFFERYLRQSPATSPRPAPAPPQSSAPANSSSSYNPFLAREEEQDQTFGPRGLASFLTGLGIGLPRSTTEPTAPTTNPFTTREQERGQTYGPRGLARALGQWGLPVPNLPETPHPSETPVDELKPWQQQQLMKEATAKAENSIEGRPASIGPRSSSFIPADELPGGGPSRSPWAVIQSAVDNAFAARHRDNSAPTLDDALWDRAVGAGDVAETEEMTWGDYDALGWRQRALVDLNTLLSDATEADRSLEATRPAKEGREDYEEMLERLGFDGNLGSDRFAPNTVALLDQLGVDTSLRDLDEFLDMTVTPTMDEITNIRGTDRQRNTLDFHRQRYEEDPRYNTDVQMREADLRRWAELAAPKIKEAMTQREGTLEDFRSTLAAQRKNIVEALGGEVVSSEQGPGFNNWGTGAEESQDAYFRALYDELQNSQRSDPLGSYFSHMQKTWDQDQLNSFFQYADSRSRNERRYGLPRLEKGAADNRVEPGAFRVMLGLDQQRE